MKPSYERIQKKMYDKMCTEPFRRLNTQGKKILKKYERESTLNIKLRQSKVIWTKTKTETNLFFLPDIITDLCSISTFNMTKMVIFSSTVYFFQPLTTFIFFLFSLITNIDFLSHLCRSPSLTHTLRRGTQTEHITKHSICFICVFNVFIFLSTHCTVSPPHVTNKTTSMYFEFFCKCSMYFISKKSTTKTTTENLSFDTISAISLGSLVKFDLYKIDQNNF